jgi:glycerophosphoryl diester phosphodiesterase
MLIPTDEMIKLIRAKKEEGALIIGHRGAMGYAPENTIASFEKGLALGADLIELDVHLSADGYLVVIHDSTVDRTTDGNGYVKDMMLAQLKKLDAGSWYRPEFAREKIPTLPEVLEWAKGRVGLVIEIKNGPISYPGIEEKVIEALKAYGMEEGVIVISFDHRCVRRVKQIRPRIATGILYVGRLIDPVAAARAAMAIAIHPKADYLTKEVVEVAHRAGLAVSTWTVNNLSRLEELIEMGVDSIGTNYPDLLYLPRKGL